MGNGVTSTEGRWWTSTWAAHALWRSAAHLFSLKKIQSQKENEEELLALASLRVQPHRISKKGSTEKREPLHVSHPKREKGEREGVSA